MRRIYTYGLVSLTGYLAELPDRRQLSIREAIRVALDFGQEFGFFSGARVRLSANLALARRVGFAVVFSRRSFSGRSRVCGLNCSS